MRIHARRSAAAAGLAAALVAGAAGLLAAALVAGTTPAQLDPEAARWVETTLGGMTLDQKIGQLVMPSFRSTYLSTDSETFDGLAALVRGQHPGGFLLFGGRDPAPRRAAQPGLRAIEAGAAPGRGRRSSIGCRRSRPLPLLNAADFETGVGFRLRGGTTFPRAMAFGAAGDEGLAFEAGRITAVEARALGVHVNFAPVADVNNNPRNPVINTRSFGEDPAVVGRLAAAWVRGLTAGGMVATLKHFPGHGDTDVDSHRRLPLIAHPRARLDRVELPPFRAGIAAGAGAVMTSHVALPGLDPGSIRPATVSAPVVTGLLRRDLGFNGLVYTDSMRMRSITNRLSTAQAAVAAVAAGHDVVVHAPDDAAAFNGLRRAVERGALTEGRIDASVRRILAAKAALGLHRTRAVSLDDLPRGGRRPAPPGGGGRGEPARPDPDPRRARRRAVDAAPFRGGFCTCRCWTIRRGGATAPRAARSCPSCAGGGRT